MLTTYVVNLCAFLFGVLCVVAGAMQWSGDGNGGGVVNSASVLIAATVFGCIVFFAWLIDVLYSIRQGIFAWLFDKVFIMILTITLFIFLMFVWNEHVGATLADLVTLSLGAVLTFVAYASALSNSSRMMITPKGRLPR